MTALERLRRDEDKFGAAAIGRRRMKFNVGGVGNSPKKIEGSQPGSGQAHPQARRHQHQTARRALREGQVRWLRQARCAAK
jgi:hypothetical protein